MRREIVDPAVIRTGDTLLVSGKSLLAQTIQEFQKCKWNHAGMFVWLNGRLYIVEASMKGIVITLFKNYEDRAGIGLLIMRPSPLHLRIDAEAYINFVLPYVGHTNYGFFDLLIAQAVRYATKKKIWIGSKKDPKKHHFICGEFVAFVYNHFNQYAFPDWNRLAPQDLFQSDLFDKLVYK